MQELIERRTRSSKTRSLGGLKRAWDGTIGAIHYRDNPSDDAEQWKEIDNIFEPAPPPWDWQMLKAGYHIRVKEDFTAGQIIEFEKQGEPVQFQPMALEWTNDLDQIQLISMPQSVVPIVTNPEVDLLPAVGMPGHQGTIKWGNAYGGGIDFEWRCSSTRLIKILEIESFSRLPTPEQYIIDGGNPVLRLNLIFDPSAGVDIYVDGELWDKSTKKQTFNVIEFRKNGEVLWGFMPLRYWGSYDGDDPALEGANRGRSIATLEKRGNKLYISIRVPYDWLQSAVHPVFIDTDIDDQVEASADDAYEDIFGCILNEATIRFGDYWGEDGSFGVRFVNISGLGGATIIDAYLRLRASGNQAGMDMWGDMYAHDVAAPQIFANSAGNKVTDRARTTTTARADGVDWGAWTDGIDYDYAGDGTTTLADIIQELATSYDPSAIALLYVDDNSGGWDQREFTTWDGNPDLAPKLHIEYTETAVAGGAGSFAQAAMALLT